MLAKVGAKLISIFKKIVKKKPDFLHSPASPSAWSLLIQASASPRVFLLSGPQPSRRHLSSNVLMISKTTNQHQTALILARLLIALKLQINQRYILSENSNFNIPQIQGKQPLIEQDVPCMCLIVKRKNCITHRPHSLPEALIFLF